MLERSWRYWRGAGEMLDRGCRDIGEVLEEMLERCWNVGEVLERYCRGARGGAGEI